MMLRTDMALTTDKEFRKYSQKYAKDEQAFFSDFSKAFSKCVAAPHSAHAAADSRFTPPPSSFRRLIHLGVPTTQLSEEVPLKKLEDQAPATA